MDRRRALLAGALVALAVLVQVTIVARLPLPGGRPQLLVLVVVAIALADGPVAGMAAGFAGGLLADLTPPSDAPLGQTALVLVLLAQAAGLLRRGDGRGLMRPLALVAVAAAAAAVLAGLVGALLGQPLAGWSLLLTGAAGAAAYTVLVAPFLLPAVGAAAPLARRRQAVALRPLANLRREPSARLR